MRQRFLLVIATLIMMGCLAGSASAAANAKPKNVIAQVASAIQQQVNDSAKAHGYRWHERVTCTATVTPGKLSCEGFGYFGYIRLHVISHIVWAVTVADDGEWTATAVQHLTGQLPT